MIDIRIPTKRGTRDDVVFVGEAPGRHELLHHQRMQALYGMDGEPFKGRAGITLDVCSLAAGLVRAEHTYANVFSFQLPKNEVKHILVPKAAVAAHLIDAGDLAPVVSIPVEKAGGYLPLEYWLELRRLWKEIQDVNPRFIVPLGGTALWATCAKHNINARRGTLIDSVVPHPAGGYYRAFPTNHPAYAARVTEARETLAKDLEKLRGYLEGAELDVTETRVPETLTEALLALAVLQPDCPMAVDVEWTKARRRKIAAWPPIADRAHDYILSIGFHQAGVSLFIPFCVGGRLVWSEADHIEIVKALRDVLSFPEYLKVFQHGQSDVVRIYEEWGIPVRGWIGDTLLLHHALDPGSEKSLEYLASRYLHMTDWKQEAEF